LCLTAARLGIRVHFQQDGPGNDRGEKQRRRVKFDQAGGLNLAADSPRNGFVTGNVTSSGRSFLEQRFVQIPPLTGQLNITWQSSASIPFRRCSSNSAAANQGQHRTISSTVSGTASSAVRGVNGRVPNGFVATPGQNFTWLTRRRA